MEELLDYWENRLKYYDDERVMTKEYILEMIEEMKKTMEGKREWHE